MLRKITKIGLVMASFAPVLALAQSFTGVSGWITAIGGVIAIALPVVVALALLLFFWGLAKFILAAGDEEAKETGKRIMIWGVIALFVMTSVWGITRFISDQLGVSGGIVIVPTVPLTP